MDTRAGPEARAALEEIQRSLTRISGELGDLAQRVDSSRLAVDHALQSLGRPAAPVPAWPAPPVPASAPSPPAAGWAPASSWPPPPGPPITALHAASTGQPPRLGTPAPPGPRRAAPGSWADTAGLKLLGWVGGGVTVLGIVLLLVIAAQNGGLSPAARVIIGLVLGAALVLGGMALHREPQRAALAVTIACTGLAVEYLTVIGAVRLADLVPPVAGFAGSALIVAVAVALAVTWKAPWLAGAAFLASGLLAMAVGGGITDTVLVFEVIMVAGGAACLLLGVGQIAWCGAGAAAALVCLLGIAAAGTSTPARVLAVAAIAVIAWGVVVGRHLTGTAVVDPGPFALRTPSTDPAQIARDYADFHHHQRLRERAHADGLIDTLSLALSAALLLLGLVTVRGDAVNGEVQVGVGIAAGATAAAFGVLAWLGRRIRALRGTAVTVTAWSMTLALVGLATLRLIGGDARGPVWVTVAALALVVVAQQRSMALLWPAFGAAVLALLSTSSVVWPSDLLMWQGTRLVGAGGLAHRAGSVVLPTGVAILAMCGAGFAAIARCTSREPVARRVTVLTWSLVGCVAVGIYGVLAVTMVLAYALSPTEGGYQAGQVAVTALIVIAGLLLLWQGFRQVVLRLGGLALAALAVGKLMLFDTRALPAMPRAVTFIGVGVLLLASAVVYLRATGRAADVPTPPPNPGAPTPATAAGGVPRLEETDRVDGVKESP